jgi:hypothetical protein
MCVNATLRSIATARLNLMRELQYFIAFFMALFAACSGLALLVSGPGSHNFHVGLWVCGTSLFLSALAFYFATND